MSAGGFAMGLSGGKLTLPISVGDVATCLGVNSLDLGTLCRSPKVNVWARFKPVEHPHVRHEDDDWWRGDDGMCGLSSPAPVTKISDVPGLFTTGGWNGWGRTYPSTWYRLADFDGYDHNAVAPIRNFGVTSPREGGTVRGTAIRAAESGEEDYDDGNLHWSELGFKIGNEAVELGDCYFGMAVEREDGTVLAVTNASPGVAEAGATTSALGLEAGDTFTAYPFLSTAALTPTSSDQQTCKMFALPGLNPASGEVASEESGLTITLNGSYMYDADGNKTGASWKVTVLHEGGWTSYFPFTNNEVRLRFSTSAAGDALLDGEGRYRMADITADEADEGFTKTGTFSIAEGYRSKSFYLYLTLRTGKFTRTVQLKQLATATGGEKELGTIDTWADEVYNDLV